MFSELYMMCRASVTFWDGILLAKRKNSWSHFTVAQPSLIFPYFDFTLMNVYRNTGIK